MKDIKSNSKLLWYIVFALLTVVMCYFFVVIYFYYISPYSVANRMTFWPFATEKQVAEMYSDTVVEINFSVENEDFETKWKEEQRRKNHKIYNEIINNRQRCCKFAFFLI